MGRKFGRRIRKAVANPIEFVIVVGVLLISMTLLMTSISQMFIPYQVENLDLKQKAATISERLIKDVGKCSDGSPDWEYHPEDLTFLGLASYFVYSDRWVEESGGGGYSIDVDAGGPYNAKINQEIQLQGSADGGYQPYSYQWLVDINSGVEGVDYDWVTSNEVQNPKIVFYKERVYNISLKVEDVMGLEGYDRTFVTVTGDPVLSYYPESRNVDMYENDTWVVTFNISNTGTGILDYQLDKDASWITSVSPSSGGVRAGETTEINVNLDTTGLSQGSYVGNVTITSDGGNGRFTIYLDVLPKPTQPVLRFYPKSGYLSLEPGQQGSLSFEIWNGGGGTLSYTLSGDSSWITSISPSSGSSTGEKDLITVNVTAPSTQGTYHGSVSIGSNGGSGSFDITLEVADPDISYYPTSYDVTLYQGETDVTSFDIWNSGTGTLTFEIGSTPGWLSCSPTSGSSVDSNDKVTINVAISTYSTSGSLMSYLSPGSYSYDIPIYSNDAENSVVYFTVNLTVKGYPTIATYPDQLEITGLEPGSTGTAEFYVYNSGDGVLYFTLSEDSQYITSMSPTSGVSNNSNDKVKITISYEAPSTYNAYVTNYITITSSNATNSPYGYAVIIATRSTGFTSDIGCTSHPLKCIPPGGEETSDPSDYTCPDSTCDSNDPNCQTSCFLSGTKVLMADGSYKNIEDIKVGEYVASYDLENGKIVPGKVIKVLHHSPDEMGDYYVVINDLIRVTPNHYLLVNGEWKRADQIKEGDVLGSQDGKGVVVESVERVYKKVPTYHLEVLPYHNYMVAMRDGVDIISHNPVAEAEACMKIAGGPVNLPFSPDLGPELCFLSGTKVLMADGSYKNIEDIKVGEYVASYDLENGKIVPGKVIEVLHHSPDEMGDYYVVINDLIRVTPNHYLLVNGEWKRADQIKEGDVLGSQDGKGVVVESVERVYKKVPTYHLEVLPYHNYMVAADEGIGGGDIISHNAYARKTSGEDSYNGGGGGCPVDSLTTNIDDNFGDSVLGTGASAAGGVNTSVNASVISPLWSVGKRKVKFINEVAFSKAEIAKSIELDSFVSESPIIRFESTQGTKQVIVEKEYISSPYLSVPLVRYTTKVKEGDRITIKRVMVVIPDEPMYGVLSPEKIKKLNNVPYERAKEALGIGEGYDFAIKITDEQGRELLYYGKGTEHARIITSFSRNVMVYPDPDLGLNQLTRATLTVYVFK